MYLLRKTMYIEFIQTDHAPSPGGHYSQAVVTNGLAFVSGQLAIDPVTGEKKTGSIEDQTLLALENVVAIVKAAGGALTAIVKVNAYITDIDLWGRVNAVYADFFGTHKPARAIIPSRDLHYGFKIEIEAVAQVG